MAIVMHEAELRPYIEACQLGERRAHVYFRAYRLMLGCAFATCPTRTAQDVVRSVPQGVLQHEGYTFKGSFEGWMRRIMVNTAIIIRRRNATGWVLETRRRLSLWTRMVDGRWRMMKAMNTRYTMYWMRWSI